MSLLKTSILILGLLWLVSPKIHAETATNFDAGQLFKFKYKLNAPVVYAVVNKSRSVNDSTSGTRNTLTRSTSEVRYKFRLTAISTNQDGTTRVLYEPFDFEQDIENVSDSGRSTLSFRGLDIVSKQNDIVVVDTSKGIGVSQAKNMKYSVYPSLLSGYFDLDSAGNIKKIDGDLPFIDQWQDFLKFNLGIFQIILPTNSISVRDSWTNNLTLKSAGGVYFQGDGIVQPHTFIRELDSTADSATNDSACFRLYETDDYKDFGGYLEQAGQRTSIAIPEHHEDMNATFHFDQKLGRLIYMKKTAKSHDSFNMMVQGNSASGQFDIDSDNSINLVSP